MDFSRPWKKRRDFRTFKLVDSSKYIIKTKQNIFTKIVSYMVTLILSIYSILVIYFFVSAIFNFNNEYIGALKISMKITNDYIIRFLMVSALVFSIIFTLLNLWKVYNKTKYGSLNRRTMPLDTTDEDILALGLIGYKDYKRVKNDDFIIFERNPIKDI